MKWKLFAVSALIICSLYGCGNDRSTSGSLYTPAPITPRPTFSTVAYYTKEEHTAKTGPDFVIYEADGNYGPYPARESEYTRTVVDKNIERKLNNNIATIINTSNKPTPQSIWDNEPIFSFSSSTSDETPDYMPLPTPKPTPTPRPDGVYPDELTGENAPYTVYSFDGKTYLGKVTLNTDDPDSIWNQSGDYGSSMGISSIYNSHSIYGSDNSGFSAFDDTATAPPIIFDKDGNVVCFLSTNLNFENGITPDTLKKFAEEKGL